MPLVSPVSLAIWIIAALATLGVITRPFRLPEAVWALSGAGLLCLTGLLPWAEALKAVAKGTDVYLFLIGMMVASELARQEGLFDYLAARAARQAAGSAPRLFALTYGVGTVVTVLMSNDATAVVLTPAVLAVARAVKVKQPLPYLYICAFVANAASFVLPVSNPANLVIFGEHMPALPVWLARFALPSLLSIGVTYAMLRWAMRADLRTPIETDIDVPALSSEARLTGWGIGLMAVVMLVASACDWPLGLPTFLAGLAVLIAVCVCKRRIQWRALGEISWGVLPLVAGLFILVEGLQVSGVIGALAHALDALSRHDAALAPWVAGGAVALLGNMINNLPAGLIAGSAVSMVSLPAHVSSAILIGVDLGPNLSVTGSLATLLWLTALRREGVHVGAVRFLLLGAVVMFPALIAALAGLQLMTLF